MHEKVLGKERLDTLTSAYYLTDMLASQHCDDKSATLYERVCAGYSAVLGNDHPITRVCHQNYSQMLASQEQGTAVPPEMPRNGASRQTGKESRLSRGLAKIGVRRSKD